MQNNIPPELKEVFRQLIKGEYEFDCEESEDKMLGIFFAVYTLGRQGREKEVADLKHQL